MGSVKLHLPSQYLQFMQRLQGRVRLFNSHGAVPHASAAGEDNNLLVSNSESNAFNLLQVVPAPLQTFPWAKACTRLAERVEDLLWNIGKWVGLPLLVVMTFTEIVFTILSGKELLMPVGLLVGTVLAGILKETAVLLGNGLQDGSIPWHLLGIGVFFTVFKIVAFMCNNWACVLLLHFASGGLWQTIRFTVVWKRSRVRMAGAEENNQ